MSETLRFGADGTLYCNTVKYNYKQCRNIVMDNTGDQLSGMWTVTDGASVVGGVGYKSYRGWHFSASYSMLNQSAPTPIAGHKYYGATMWKTSGSSFSASDARFEWFVGDISNGTMVFANKTVATNGSWVKLSSVQSLSTVPSGSWVIRNFVVSPSTESWVSRMIIIDLTDTFGSGNEPDATWCDNNILEWDKFVNFNSLSPQVTNSNIGSYFGSNNFEGFWGQGYGQWDTNWAPRDYFFSVQTNASASESTASSSSSPALTNTTLYYAFFESAFADQSKYVSGLSNDFYFPIAEPRLGQVSMVKGWDYNGGGGMMNWKRVSFFNNRNSFSNGSYQFRVDYNNNYNSINFWFTNLWLGDVSGTIAQYNSYNGTSLTTNDINKEWCDRYIGGRGDSIIHIKDPNNTTIKFNTDYDIVCNDIKIEPNISKIYFDSTGTIHCKKLVRVQEY